MLSENIKKIREQKKLSKTQLAKEANLSFREIEFLEKRKILNPRFKTILALAKSLDVSIDELTK